MCGICGKLLLSETGAVEPALIAKMNSAMSHRGPDDSGVYTARNIGLGHRRLSIIDLQTGKQPLSNEDNTVWVVFNGEIYNFRELRNELLRRGHTFKTQTDTEVIVHLYEDHGEDFVQKLRGMFAIALWDETSETLILARDRVGIKPLYYFMNDDCLLFGSEIKSILADPAVPRDVDLNGLRLLLAYYYIPGADTLLKGVKKLLPGHCLIVSNGKVVDKEYWDLSFVPHQEGLTIEEATEGLVGTLRRSVREHMISDVPVGFLLSGGVDSTGLLSLAVEETGKKFCSYTVGFEGETFADERPYARLASEKYGTDHHEISLTAKEFLDFLPNYVWYMEEPICEPPAVALYYVSKLAKDHVKVLISGEGGDEAFAGYESYRNLLWLERIKGAVGPLKHVVGQIISSFTQMGASGKLGRYGRLMGMEFEDYYLSRSSTPLSFFNANIGAVLNPGLLDSDVGGRGRDRYRKSLLPKTEDMDLLNKMLYLDSKTWLPDDLLLKADKMTMATSIELRVPLLDHLVLEYAASLPVDFKLKGCSTKYILKKALAGLVPNEILHRKKTGFPVPYEQWLSKELNGYVRDLLLGEKAIQRGYFQKETIVRLLEENRNGPSHSKEIFLLVAIELWHRSFID